MRLLSLEIKGFKSFARETIVHFNENVTGIVGPNGSGKSNIIDAIRWVLGEQKSRELRLEKMQDVIFNGTKKRKKSGAAEVSITFENSKGILPSEYNIVKVTRTLYRSGDSEYKLNDVLCRLKDIKNLLVDTGIGSNSYAIIELGMVDAILQDKENSRRKMFEQAAGISKYKTRKKETLSKLSLTQTDLDRVEDLLFEIKSNLKGLEKQARRAKKYLDIKQKYKELSLVFYSAKRSLLRDEYMKIEKEIVQLNVKYNDLRARINLKEAALEKQKLKNINDEKQLSLFQQKISSITDEIRRKESRKEILQKEISFSDEKLSGLERRVKDLTEKLNALKLSKSKVEDSIVAENVLFEELRSIYQKYQGVQDELKSKYERNKATVEQKAKEKLEWEKQLLALEKEHAISTNKIQQAENTINYLSERDNELINKQKENGQILGSTQQTVKSIEEQLANLREEDSKRKANLSEIDTDLENKRTLHRNAQRVVDVKKNEISLLESIINKYEGYSESIKFLQKEWKNEKVLLSDIISCDEKDKAVIELVLGDYLDYFVVDTFEEAVNAVDLLVDKKRGKAKFFVLEHIPALEKNNVELDSVVGKLTFDKKYKKLIEYILYDIYIVTDNKSIDKSLLVHGLANEDGTFLVKNGQILGGSQSQFDSNKIGRKAKLDKLKAKLIKLQNDEQSIREDIKSLEKRKIEWKERNFQNEINKLQGQLNEKNRVLFKLQADQESLDKQIEDQSQNLTSQKENIKTNKAKLTQLEADKEKISDILKEYSPAEGESSALTQLTEELSLKAKETNDANINMIRQQNRMETLNTELKVIEEKFKETTAELNAVTTGIEREKSKEISRQSELRKIKTELSSDYEKRKAEKADLGGIELSYFEEKEKINNEENTLRTWNKEFTEIQGQVNRKKDKSTDIKFKLQGIKQRVNIEFNEHIDKVEVEIPEGFSIDEQEIQIDKLQNRLANFGEINPMAVEAYNEMEERLKNIQVQRDDILEAKEQLIKTMKEIETTATTLFLEAFEKIRGHFITVFRSLFTQDDNCDLILLDPENPLSSGIEIIAKPKGKRPQSLSQLSGGEKTLTASALLFSLYLLKPAPFCIFDEVDAPLDDHNVQKFTNIIRAFSHDSQFLVVTHNKATMAELDVLYGVYMEEKGVSGVSQVDFRNYEHNTVMTEAVN
jgi:chromosome segregation protein